MRMCWHMRNITCTVLSHSLYHPRNHRNRSARRDQDLLRSRDRCDSIFLRSCFILLFSNSRAASGFKNPEKGIEIDCALLVGLDGDLSHVTAI